MWISFAELALRAAVASQATNDEIRTCGSLSIRPANARVLGVPRMRSVLRAKDRAVVRSTIMPSLRDLLMIND
jgi:hypothetical protein